MTKFLATLALMTLMTANALAAFWFGYGLWPTNVWAFIALNGFASSVLRVLADRVLNEKKDA